MNAAELPILSIMLAVPMIGALACLFARAEMARIVALTATLFNLLLGREIQKAHGQEPQIVLTLPLLLICAVLPTAFTGVLQRIDADALPQPEALLQLTEVAYQNGRTVPPELIEPAYLRDKVALTLAERAGG